MFVATHNGSFVSNPFAAHIAGMQGMLTVQRPCKNKAVCRCSRDKCCLNAYFLALTSCVHLLTTCNNNIPLPRVHRRIPRRTTLLYSSMALPNAFYHQHHYRQYNRLSVSKLRQSLRRQQVTAGGQLKGVSNALFQTAVCSSPQSAVHVVDLI